MKNLSYNKKKGKGNYYEKSKHSGGYSEIKSE